jgi:hypothetical protein
VEKGRGAELLQKGLQNFTGTAFLHLFFQRATIRAITASTADKPAQVAALEFPGRALIFQVAILFFPAGNGCLVFSFMVAKKKKDLPFYVTRNISPTLFVAVHSLQGYA